MEPRSPSSPPPSDGLVCGELQYSWPCIFVDEPPVTVLRTSTPFDQANDLVYLDSLKTPKPKRIDKLSDILRGYIDTSPELETSTTSPKSCKRKSGEALPDQKVPDSSPLKSPRNKRARISPDASPLEIPQHDDLPAGVHGNPEEEDGGDMAYISKATNTEADSAGPLPEEHQVDPERPELSTKSDVNSDVPGPQVIELPELTSLPLSAAPEKIPSSDGVESPFRTQPDCLIGMPKTPQTPRKSKAQRPASPVLELNVMGCAIDVNSPSPDTTEGFIDGPQDPADKWKQAIDDDSTPAIFHKIARTLHRCLKSKEDAIDDIADEYRDKALQLITKLKLRHNSEQSETLASHQEASARILAACTEADEVLELLVKEITALDIEAMAMEELHPGLADKFDLVCRLYDAKWKSTDHTKSGNNATVDDEPAAGEDHDQEELVLIFQTKLRQKVKLADPASNTSLQKLHAKADKLLRRVSHASVEESELTQEVEPKKITIYDVIEEALDKIIGYMQPSGENGRASFGDNVSDREAAAFNGIQEVITVASDSSYEE